LCTENLIQQLETLQTMVDRLENSDTALKSSIEEATSLVKGFTEMVDQASDDDLWSFNFELQSACTKALRAMSNHALYRFQSHSHISLASALHLYWTRFTCGTLHYSTNN